MHVSLIKLCGEKQEASLSKSKIICQNKNSFAEQILVSQKRRNVGGVQKSYESSGREGSTEHLIEWELKSCSLFVSGNCKESGILKGGVCGLCNLSETVIKSENCFMCTTNSFTANNLIMKESSSFKLSNKISDRPQHEMELKQKP